MGGMKTIRKNSPQSNFQMIDLDQKLSKENISLSIDIYFQEFPNRHLVRISFSFNPYQ